MTDADADRDTAPPTPDVAQVLAGQPVAAAGHAFCARCKRPVREGEPVTAYAYRLADDSVWSVARLFCDGCDRTTIPTPTLGAHEVVVRARLAVRQDAPEQSRRGVLAAPEIVARSGPTEGARP